MERKVRKTESRDSKAGRDSEVYIYYSIESFCRLVCVVLLVFKQKPFILSKTGER